MQDSKRDTDVFGLYGRGRGGMIWGNVMETCVISHKRQITSPGSIQDPWGWCTGMSQRDGYGEGGGVEFRMENMCMPVVDSC